MNLESFSENFETLTDAPNAVVKLREIILQLAVRGKLVRQDPNDEPAQILFDRIKAEIQEFIKQKKVREIKALPLINDKDKPFEIPQNWKWCRLGEIIRISSGDSLSSHKMANEGTIPVYGGNGITGYHDQANVNQPTLVIGRVGFYCGSVHLTPNLAWITDNAFITYFSDSNIYIHFLYWLLKATDLQQNNNATAQPVISGGKVYPLVVGLPPLPEQKRIVAKVDRLMSLCDELEGKLKEVRSRNEKLMEVAAQEVLTV